MVLLVQTPTPMRWQTRLLGYLPGIIVGLGLAWSLRSTQLDSATRVFLSTLPMWVLFRLASEIGGPSHRWPTRLVRASAYALLVSSIMYGVMRLGQ